MATIVKDLGAATAYGYAVEKGYTGTEEEFAELMASYASVAESIENDVPEIKLIHEGYHVLRHVAVVQLLYSGAVSVSS
jgi:hypothetical protein